MKELVGRRVHKLFVNDDQSLLVFETDGGRVAYRTEADCCSETWFADILGVAALRGGVVAAAQDVDLPVVVDGRSRQEEDAFYGVTITTDKGRTDIVYRNSSNGYYGGSVCAVPVGELPKNLVEIIADWQAQAPKNE